MPEGVLLPRIDRFGVAAPNRDPELEPRRVCGPADEGNRHVLGASEDEPDRHGPADLVLRRLNPLRRENLVLRLRLGKRWKLENLTTAP